MYFNVLYMLQCGSGSAGKAKVRGDKSGRGGSVTTLRTEDGSRKSGRGKVKGSQAATSALRRSLRKKKVLSYYFETLKCLSWE